MVTPEPISENITQELYKRNVELAVKNKTLSLLSKLYEISILTLEPVSLAEHVVQTIQTELEFDLVGMFRYDDKTDELIPLHITKSKRFEEILGETNEAFNNFIILGASQRSVLKEIFFGLSMSHTEELIDIWNGFISENTLKIIKQGAHLRTVLLCPLTIRDKKVLGVLVIGFNRMYSSLSEFEQESIHNFVNVIATAYDKALLYQELEITNHKLEDANTNLTRLDQTKSEFMSIASHQLRAPLTVIKGYLSLALEGTLGKIPDQAKEPLGKAAYSTEQLIKLVNEFLNLSRMEAGKIEYKMAMNDLTLIVKELMDELHPQAVKKNIDIKFGSQEKLNQCIFDKDKIREVILNLLHNAIKYSPGGDILIYQEVVHREARKFVRVSIKDNGIGVAKEDIPRLFTKFVRLTEAKEVDINGLGLGLYFVKRVVEDHGGSVWVESEGLGKGSTFIVEIPYKEIS